MTPKIPLILKLKKELQRNIAKAQDIIIEELPKTFPNAVLHGGTAIWRCYHGNRFSEDIDAYLPKNMEKIEEFFKILENKGFKIEKKKISENSIYSELKLDRTSVRFEAVFKLIKGNLINYETAEGNILPIPCLNAEEIIKEKVNAYSNRLKIRDLYDIFFLLRYIDNKETIKKELLEFISNFKKPKDEKDLSILIIEGLVPTIEQMLNYIKREAK